jgi:hypothetical protein
MRTTTLTTHAQRQKRALAARQRQTDAALAYAARVQRADVQRTIAAFTDRLRARLDSGQPPDVAWLLLDGGWLQVQAALRLAGQHYALAARPAVAALVADSAQQGMLDAEALIEQALAPIREVLP